MPRERCDGIIVGSGREPPRRSCRSLHLFLTYIHVCINVTAAYSLVHSRVIDPSANITHAHPHPPAIPATSPLSTAPSQYSPKTLSTFTLFSHELFKELLTKTDFVTGKFLTKRRRTTTPPSPASSFRPRVYRHGREVPRARPGINKAVWPR